MMIFNPRFHGFFYLDHTGHLMYAKSSDNSAHGQVQTDQGEWVDLDLEDEFTEDFRQVHELLKQLTAHALAKRAAHRLRQ